MSESRAIRVRDGGSVSLEREPAAEARTRLDEVATADRTVALGVILTSDEAVDADTGRPAAAPRRSRERG